MKSQSGSRLLLVTGILMIIAGIYNAISFIRLWPIPSFVIPAIIAELISSIALIVIQFTAGIFGVVNWNKPQRANLCIVLAVIYICVNISAPVIAVITGFLSFGNAVFAFLLSIIIPLFYIKGVKQNKLIGR